MKFKVGDKVRIIDRAESLPCGTIATVTKESCGGGAGGNVYVTAGTDKQIILGDHLELVESPKFKVGDKVKTSDGNGIIVAKADNSTGNLVEIPDYNGHNGDGFNLTEGNKPTGSNCTWRGDVSLKLIESPKFKVGDRVRISENATNGGETGIIERPANAWDWHILLDDGSKDLHFEEDLELVEPSCTTINGFQYKHIIQSEITFTPVKSNRKGVLDMLRSIPARIKRVLNPRTRALYQLDWISDDLNLSTRGRDQMDQLLHDTYADELGDLAIKEVARLKREAKK